MFKFHKDSSNKDLKLLLCYCGLFIYSSGFYCFLSVFVNLKLKESLKFFSVSFLILDFFARPMKPTEEVHEYLITK